MNQNKWFLVAMFLACVAMIVWPLTSLLNLTEHSMIGFMGGIVPLMFVAYQCCVVFRAIARRK